MLKCREITMFFSKRRYINKLNQENKDQAEGGGPTLGC